MRDAIVMSVEHVERTARNARKVLVLITQGNDNSSTVTQIQLLNKIKASTVRVYCIGLPSEDRPAQASGAALALGEIADASGALFYHPQNLSALQATFPEISDKVRGH